MIAAAPRATAADAVATIPPPPAATVSPPWPERVEAARRLVDAIASRGWDDIHLEALEALVADPKWEVRQVVANHLLAMPDDYLIRWAGRLKQDHNHFVRVAAERALERHRRGVQVQDRRRTGFREVGEQIATLARLHGPTMVAHVQRLVERAYDVTVGGTVHELRGVITPLLSAAETLARELQPGAIVTPRLAVLATRLRDRARFLEELADDLRQYSQATPPERHPESLARLVADGQRLAADWFAARGLDIGPVPVTAAIPPGIAVAVARLQVLVVLRNLIKNAIESCADGPTRFRPGSVHIEAHQADGQVTITVTDTGSGLSPEELAAVRRFVPGETTLKVHGTGFGLPIAYRKVRDHGGMLAIASTLGVGTTVTLTLPVEGDILRSLP